MERFDLVSVVIPSYNPTQSLIKVVKDIREQGFCDIIIINDGSNNACLPFFNEVEGIKGCVVLTHSENYGKGKALKTGMAFFLQNRPDSAGLVTIDDDGQHLPDDVKNCVQIMLETGAFVLGIRDLKKAGVPAKSRFGNTVMKILFSLASGFHLSDTQTGLRAIPRHYVEPLLAIPGDRFDYETKVLLAAKEQEIEIRQVPITTIYIQDNSGTRFKALADSFAILLQFSKYIIGSLLSFGIDFLVFFALLTIFSSAYSPDNWYIISISTLSARMVSSVFNFIFNKNFVFGYKNKNVRAAALRYFALWCFSLLMSSQLVALISRIPLINTAALVAMVKIVIDATLFIVNYIIQRRWVFKQ